METPRIATIGLLLSVILIAWPVMGEPAGRPQGPSAGGSANVLLQEGLYAEEIEGDLDGAIKIYERVLVEAKDIEQAAAQATYRIGICFLKKGDKTQAARQFQQVIEKFPGQEALVAKTQEQLAKIQPAPVSHFGPVIERIIHSEESDKGFFYDLDAAKTFSPPEGLTRSSPPQEVMAWSRENGIDLVNDRGQVELADMIAVRVANKLWDSADPSKIASALKQTPHKSNISAQSDTTYVFETREGGSGILQILEKKDNNLRIRYKMLRAGKTPQQLTKLEPPPTGDFGPVVERVVYQGGSDYECLIDFESGKLFTFPENLKDLPTDDARVLSWLKENGIDAVGAMNGALPGLEGLLELVVQKMSGLGWDVTPRELVAEMGPRVAEMGPRQQPHKARIFAVGGLPFTYFFKTGQGGMGVLQMLELIKGDSPAVRIRYKMLRDTVLSGQLRSNLYEQLDYEVIQAIGGKYGGISSEGGAKNLYSNSHIYCVTSDWMLLTGGMGYYRNESDQPRTERVRLSGTSSPKQTLYDVAGRQMNTEIVQDKVRPGFYHIYWTPSEAIPPGQMFYYGWSNDQSRTLRQVAPVGQYALTMQNHFGDRVVETFFLVVPLNTNIVSRTEEFTARDTVGGFDVYYWSKEVPPNTEHKVDVILGVSHEQLAEIVRKAVLTISTCAESDPKVTRSLDTLYPLQDKPVVDALCKYLDSDTATVRRSAIFILWRGGFDGIAPAEEKLIKLCGHEENLTRGMAALALGQAKASAAYEILADKTQNDSDGYVRRCAAYALGLYGDKKAVPVLEKALEDKDPLVKGNAQAAITMLTELKDSEQK